MYYIYALVDPSSDELFYVGCTTQKPSRRLREHRDLKHARSSKVKTKVASILRLELVPSMLVLEVTADKAREQHWISYLGKLGASLLNTATTPTSYSSLSKEEKRIYHKMHYTAWKKRQ